MYNFILYQPLPPNNVLKRTIFVQNVKKQFVFSRLIRTFAQFFKFLF